MGVVLCARSSSGSGETLLTQSDFTYLGAFRLPDAFNFGGWSAGYNNNSLIVSAQLAWPPVGYWGEVAIPATLYTGSDLNTLTGGSYTPTTIQAPADILQDGMADIIPTSGNLRQGGLAVVGSSLYVGITDVYDGNNVVTLSHFKTGLDFSKLPAAVGPVQVGNANRQRFVGQYMEKIPSAWQSALGGDLLTGSGSTSTINSTSLGPAASVITASDIGVGTPVSAVPVVEYPIDHWTIGSWSSPAFPPWAAAPGVDKVGAGTTLGGIVWCANTRTVLFIGGQGTGSCGYATGTSNQSLDATVSANGSGSYKGKWDANTSYSAGDSVYYDNASKCGYYALQNSVGHSPPTDLQGTNDNDYWHHSTWLIYDPETDAKGQHAYPYEGHIWAYDANDLLDVKNGAKNPWEIVPYAGWALPLNFQYSYLGALSVAHDSTNKRIYVVGPTSTANAIRVVYVYGY